MMMGLCPALTDDELIAEQVVKRALCRTLHPYSMLLQILKEREYQGQISTEPRQISQDERIEITVLDMLHEVTDARAIHGATRTGFPDCRNHAVTLFPRILLILPRLLIQRELVVGGNPGVANHLDRLLGTRQGEHISAGAAGELSHGRL